VLDTKANAVRPFALASVVQSALPAIERSQMFYPIPKANRWDVMIVLGVFVIAALALAVSAFIK